MSDAHALRFPPTLPDLVLAAFSPRGAATRQQLLRLGVDDAMLKRWVRLGALRRHRRGTYSLPSVFAERSGPADEAELATLTLAGPDVVVSHRSAAQLHGLPLVRPVDRPEITRDETGAVLLGVRCHRYGVAPGHAELVRSIPVTTVPRTLVDLCRVLPTAQALPAWDLAAARDPAAPALAQRLLDDLGDINFRRRVRQAAGWVDGRSESPLESLSRGLLLGRGLPRPEVQAMLSTGTGRFRVDLLWPGLGVVGEADGRGKYGDDERAVWAEKRRQEWLEQQGLVVVRWIWQELVNDLDGVARRWHDAVQRQRSRGFSWPAGLRLTPTLAPAPPRIGPPSSTLPRRSA